MKADFQQWLQLDTKETQVSPPLSISSHGAEPLQVKYSTTTHMEE